MHHIVEAKLYRERYAALSFRRHLFDLRIVWYQN